MVFGRKHDRNDNRPAVHFPIWLALIFCCLQISGISAPLLAQPKEEKKEAEQPQPPDKKDEQVEQKVQPIARYLKVKSPIDDAIFRAVRNTALALQEQAILEDRPGFLILELQPGQSEFHQALGLAQFLSSSKVDRLTTIAWVPETLTGNNVIVALGCQEIVLQADVSLGDIGRGKPVDAAEEQAILALVDKKHNLKVSRDLAAGLLNPQVTLMLVTIEKQGQREQRVVTEQQAKILRENQVTITDVQVLKDQGKPGLFSGQQARQGGFLIHHAIGQQAELAELYGMDPQALKVQQNPEESQQVRLIEVTEIIDPVLESFLERQIDRALTSGAKTLIFRIESPGGYLISGMNLANKIADLSEQGIRTIAWVPEQALSSAAITALGCDEIYIGPQGQIGDAGVIRQEFDGAFERVPEKVISPLLQTLKALGERKNRPPAILEAMTLKDLEVYEVRHKRTGRVWYMSEEELAEAADYIKGPLVAESKEGLLLTLQGERAVDLKIAAAVVKDLDDLKERTNIPPDVDLKPVARTWVDTLIYLLNDPIVTGFLFFIAIICIYIELHFMVGIFGITSALCFGIFFWSRYLGGTANGLEILLFFIGLCCLLLEIFVIPGFGVFGVSGGLLMLLSLILAMETFNNLEPEVDSQKLVQSVSMLAIPLLAVMATSMAIGKYLPKIPFLNQIILTPPISQHLGDTSQLQLNPALVDAKAGTLQPGDVGLSLTILRPSGKARFNNRIVDVISQGPYIQEQTRVEIIEARGNRIVVREAEPA